MIKEKINYLQCSFKQDEFSKHLIQLSSPELFYVSEKKDERMIDVLSIMSNKLIELDYVKDDFLMNVLEREELSSTAFSFFAIPHSINMDAKRTTIAFYLNKNGIEWDGKKVKLVILPCFNSIDRKNFNKIFEMFTDTLVNISNVDAIVSVSNLKEFEEQLKMSL